MEEKIMVLKVLTEIINAVLMLRREGGGWGRES